MNHLLVRSYGKINLALNVVGKTVDGFHSLDMIMLPIELHDSILISKLAKATDNCVTMDDFSHGIITRNLATDAIDIMGVKFKFNNKFRVAIHKNIPMKSGLGGGSSNAAYTMKGVCKLLKINPSDEDLFELGKYLGSDVPFFFKTKPMRCQGRGEIMTPIEIKNNYYVLLVKPDEGCSTKEVFHMVDNEKNVAKCDIDKLIQALKDGDDDTIAETISNSLENSAIQLVPEIQKIKDEMKQAGLKIVMMSGSGSTVFGMSTDKKLINKIAEQFEDRYLTEVTRILK